MLCVREMNMMRRSVAATPRTASSPLRRRGVTPLSQEAPRFQPMFPNRSRVVGLCMAVLLGWLLGGCATPGSPALAESVASGYTRYAYAVVSFEADRLEGRSWNQMQTIVL